MNKKKISQKIIKSLSYLPIIHTTVEKWIIHGITHGKKIRC